MPSISEPLPERDDDRFRSEHLDEMGTARRAALEDARRAAITAVRTTGVSRGAALAEAPACHKAKCWCDSDTQVERLVDLILTCAADEVARALILEQDEDEARLNHRRAAWDEGYMHVMKHGMGRITRGMNPYLPDDYRLPEVEADRD